MVGRTAFSGRAARKVADGITVGSALGTFGLEPNVAALHLTFHQLLKIVVIALAAGVVEQFALARARVVPVATDAARAFAHPFGLGANGLGGWTANFVARIALVGAGTVRGC